MQLSSLFGYRWPVARISAALAVPRMECPTVRWAHGPTVDAGAGVTIAHYHCLVDGRLLNYSCIIFDDDILRVRNCSETQSRQRREHQLDSQSLPPFRFAEGQPAIFRCVPPRNSKISDGLMNYPFGGAKHDQSSNDIFRRSPRRVRARFCAASLGASDGSPNVRRSSLRAAVELVLFEIRESALHWELCAGRCVGQQRGKIRKDR